MVSARVVVDFFWPLPTMIMAAGCRAPRARRAVAYAREKPFLWLAQRSLPSRDVLGRPLARASWPRNYTIDSTKFLLYSPATRVLDGQSAQGPAPSWR